MSGPTHILWYSSVAVQFLFCAHLLWSRLARKHPFFTLYLGCSVVRSLGAMHFSVMAGGSLPISYTYFWLWTEPVLLLLQLEVALEVHSSLWKDYERVTNLGLPLLLAGIFGALVLAAAPVAGQIGESGGIPLRAVMQFEFLAKRYVSSVLAVFLIASAVLFLFVVRSSLNWNLFRHEGMLAAYFAIYAVAYLIVGSGWRPAVRVNNYMLSALTLCLVIWISIFKPQEEQTA